MGVVFITYSVAINSSFVVLTVLAMSDYAAYRRRSDFAAYDESFAEPLARGVSVLMPAYNEELTIVASVEAMTSLRYPDFEVIVIDDGSKDATVATMIAAFDMVEFPLARAPMVDTLGEVLATYISRRGSMNLVLVCKTNGGKADALNVGINVARKELVCMVDADSLLDPDALLHVSRPFADDPERVIASGGVVRVANGSTIAKGRVVKIDMPRRWLPRVQVVEYLRAFLIGRAGWSAAGGLLIISGAFGMFRRDILFELNGVATDCIGEDAELVVRLYRWMGDNDVDGRIVFVSEPVAWTEAPETRQVLASQRRRWHRGLTEIFVRHRGMILRPRYGFIGMITMPWFLLFELLAPFLEVFGLIYFAVIMVLLGLGEPRCGALGLGGPAGGDHAAGHLDRLLGDDEPGGAAHRGAVLPALPRDPGVADRRLGRGRGEHRLPAAHRVVADEGQHRRRTPLPARVGRHEAHRVHRLEAQATTQPDVPPAG